jgi:heptaprenyl diphosphate synthase
MALTPRPIETEKSRIVAVFGALCLFFSALEFLMPRPIPFFRVGLSNIPILLALDFMPLGQLLLLVLLKALGQGLLNGTLVSYVFLFSLSGSLASLAFMYPLHRLLGARVSLIGLGCGGALASNLVQVALSIVFIFGPESAVIAPVLLGIGVASGILMGYFAQAFKDRSAWLRRVAERWRGRLP